MSEPSGFDQQLNALRALSDFNQLLHTLRTYELAAIPRGAEVFLSAGCAGTWYFDWIEQTYGRVQRHIGIEYFMPEPPGLPDYVTWIANTVADMEAVADSSVDLVFSGQNIEHLWPSDVAGFLVESFRTLKTGGLLVIDSPNRLVTRPLGWRHPQHTMEFTPQEARVLLSMSGFDVTSLRGIWMVRDPFTETLL
jgi:SAM-dependent methyltransferase